MGEDPGQSQGMRADECVGAVMEEEYLSVTGYRHGRVNGMMDDEEGKIRGRGRDTRKRSKSRRRRVGGRRCWPSHLFITWRDLPPANSVTRGLLIGGTGLQSDTAPISYQKCPTSEGQRSPGAGWGSSPGLPSPVTSQAMRATADQPPQRREAAEGHFKGHRNIPLLFGKRGSGDSGGGWLSGKEQIFLEGEASPRRQQTPTGCVHLSALIKSEDPTTNKGPDQKA
ncbi:hypothetical protein AAFF_G00074340 [Aldrovandia affinis]|uniref:Uncharacterized protein n=1 Tax=Aldrovandia affinis TaxID=143900 RepID=A0AAD7S0T9_9TELE|nr:hypothetical protein AAFF_G00074340 [Aldrovandia affinis]